MILCSSAAHALIIRTTFDSSVTRLANASTVESAFNTVAAKYSAAFANPVTVNITVSWGSVGYQPLGSGDIAGSVENLSGPYSYASLVNNLKANLPYNPGDSFFASAVHHLPAADPSRLNEYEIPYADAKALGLISANRAATDGYVGFKSGMNFDFNQANGISAGSYDFQGFAAHEIAEVLGRITGLPSAGAASWATPFDVLRYTANGVHSFSSSAAAYLSIDGGLTNLGNFNTVGAGDRGDWLAATAGADASSAFFNTGTVYRMTVNDLIALDALGWGSWSPAAFGLVGASEEIFSDVSHGMGAVPEPTSWALMFVGLSALGAGLRSRRMTAIAV